MDLVKILYLYGYSKKSMERALYMIFAISNQLRVTREKYTIFPLTQYLMKNKMISILASQIY